MGSVDLSYTDVYSNQANIRSNRGVMRISPLVRRYLLLRRSFLAGGIAPWPPLLHSGLLNFGWSEGEKVSLLPIGN